MMVFIFFIGMIASGVIARVTLLSHRGGWFFKDQSRKPIGMIIFDIIVTLLGLIAFVISFMLFNWWIPMVALAFGYWFAAPMIVNRSTYSFFYQTQVMTSLIALICSILIILSFFEVV